VANLDYFQLPFPRYQRFCQPSHLWKTPAEEVSCLYSMHDGRLCVGLDNGSIQICNTILSFDCEMELLGHTDYVKCILRLTDGRLCDIF
jgi:hypothetical protein